MHIPKKMLTILLLFFLLAQAYASSTRRSTVNIWRGVAKMRGERTLMEANIPNSQNGSAVIICPGGSYHHLGFYNEGRTTAAWFCSKGVTAFILSYRVAQDFYHYPAQMQDIQRAIQYVRQNANVYGINPNKVGLIGFSAGGHLVAWAGEFANRTDELTKLGIDHAESLRPDFVVPVYPVVSMQDDIGHRWSRKSLLGKNPSAEQKDLFSLELNVPADMPPVYLVACKDDPVVLYENSVRLYNALLKKDIHCTFASYEWGGHGFGMQNNAFMRSFHWNEGLEAWLTSLNFL